MSNLQLLFLLAALRGSGQAGAAEELFQAANTAAMNLATSMNLKEHPASCECYGCRLTRAVINFALARAKETVRPIVERELKAEQSFAGLKERWRTECSLEHDMELRSKRHARELEALEQRVRELLDELESSGGKGADGFYRYSINVENRLTALLGDKP